MYPKIGIKSSLANDEPIEGLTNKQYANLLEKYNKLRVFYRLLANSWHSAQLAFDRHSGDLPDTCSHSTCKKLMQTLEVTDLSYEEPK